MFECGLRDLYFLEQVGCDEPRSLWKSLEIQKTAYIFLDHGEVVIQFTPPFGARTSTPA